MGVFKSFGFDNDTKKYLDAVAATGGSISYGTAQAVNNFVETCKSSGIWDQMVDVGVFVGNDLNTALVKLKWHPVAGPYLVNGGSNFGSTNYQERGQFGGLSGNGTNTFLNTNLPSFRIGNTSHLAFYLARKNFAEGVTNLYIGAENSANIQTSALGHGNAGTEDVFRWAPTSFGWIGVTRSAGSGLMIGCMDPNTRIQQLYNNNVLIGSGVANSGINGTSNMYIFADNQGGNTVAPLNGIGTFYSIGYGLTAAQSSGLYSAVQGLQSALGRGI
jgi:hypothetical protein